MAESIKVIVRSRPLNVKEINQGSKMVVSFPGPNTITLNDKPYNFDAVIPTTATQADVYQVAGLPVVQNIINGYNGTIFAYGQTSSGKTHTMIGKPGDPKHIGLIPRIVGAIFDYIVKTASNTTFLVKVSYLEIYMEKVRDLLDVTKENLPLFEDVNKSTYVKGATVRFVSTPEEIFDILEEGRLTRKVASTAMNMDSSRSHSIFSLTLHQDEISSKKTVQSRLYLVDLAGSEKVSKTAAEGQTLDEAKGINKSLSALGNVINALTEGVAHVPYRDSKLTRILQDSLGGNSKTTMIICCSPAAFNESETKSTLLFGLRAKTIKNIVTVNVELSAEEWKRFYNELKAKYEALANAYRHLEAEVKKWRNGESVPPESRCKPFHIPDVKGPGGEVNPPADVEAARASVSGGRNSIPMDPGNAEIYKDLDIKDEEIAIAGEKLNKVRSELTATQEKLQNVSAERDQLQNKSQKMTSELNMKSKELKDVLATLEELSATVQKKTNGEMANQEEYAKAQDENRKIMTQIKEFESQVAGYRSGEVKLKNIIFEGLEKMKADLEEIATHMNPSIGKPKPNANNKLEEEFTNMQIFISKLRGECQNFVNKGRNGLIGKIAEPLKKIELLDKRIVSQKKNYDDRIVGLMSDKRSLESELNNLKRENMRMKADLKISKSESGEKVQTQIKQITDQYITDVTDVRNALNEKSKENQDLKDKLDIANSELDLLRKNGMGLDTVLQIDKREAAKNEVRGLEENIQQELGNLSNLRKMFINDLKNRIKKVSHRPTMREIMLDDEDEYTTGEKLSPQQRERLKFLETNLDSLTKAHKQLVKENADLRSELPKMEKRVKASTDRMKQLESALKESKESSLKERKRYLAEIDKVKDSFKNRGAFAKSSIAKPIMAGTMH